MTKRQITLLKGLMFSYAVATINEAKEKSYDTVWYKQAKEINKYFSKRKPEKITKSEKTYYDKVSQDMFDFDTKYFQGKLYSYYICMYAILEYLVLEERDTEMRLRFGHYPYNTIRSELYELDGLKDVAIDIDHYIGAVLDNLEKIS